MQPYEYPDGWYGGRQPETEPRVNINEQLGISCLWRNGTLRDALACVSMGDSDAYP